MPISEAIATLAELSGSPAFPVPDQAYLLEARQMQALSLGVHIPLVCFGIAFPAMVLFMEGLHLRTTPEQLAGEPEPRSATCEQLERAV